MMLSMIIIAFPARDAPHFSVTPAVMMIITKDTAMVAAQVPAAVRKILTMGLTGKD